MTKIFLTAFFLLTSTIVQASPACKAIMMDEFNVPMATTEWNQDLYIGHIEAAEQAILISTSLGDNKVMSLWVREKTQGHPAGMFTFIDLSSGRNQSSTPYLRNGTSVNVTCRWSE